jgi:hypothetical protein
VADHQTEKDQNQETTSMGPLARLAAVETWARSEFGNDLPEPLRLALYGDVQPADMVRVGGSDDEIVCTHDEPSTDGLRFALPGRAYCYTHGRWERVTSPEGESWAVRYTDESVYPMPEQATAEEYVARNPGSRDENDAKPFSCRGCEGEHHLAAIYEKNEAILAAARRKGLLTIPPGEEA